VGGDVVTGLWRGGRQDIILLGAAGVEQAHLLKDLLSSLSLCNPFSKLDLVGCFIEPLHSTMLKLTLRNIEVDSYSEFPDGLPFVWSSCLSSHIDGWYLRNRPERAIYMLRG
jgi:hypothetical protein